MLITLRDSIDSNSQVVLKSLFTHSLALSYDVKFMISRHLSEVNKFE